MNPSNTISLSESFIEDIFASAELTEAPVINHQRVEKVLERAIHERLIADTSSFLFKGIPAATEGLISLANRTVGNDNVDYRA